jgi:hypothetical protein
MHQSRLYDVQGFKDDELKSASGKESLDRLGDHKILLTVYQINHSLRWPKAPTSVVEREDDLEAIEFSSLKGKSN